MIHVLLVHIIIIVFWPDLWSDPISLLAENLSFCLFLSGRIVENFLTSDFRLTLLSYWICLLNNVPLMLYQIRDSAY